MCHTTVNLPELPASTEDIRQALAEVEARLSAWSAAMAAIHAEFAGTPGAAPPAAEPPAIAAAEPPAPAPKPAEPEPATAAVAAAPAETTGLEEPSATMSPEEPAEPARQVKSARRAGREAPAPPPRPVISEEDEALLASLDPETAKAIRVMRRLSDQQKSVRELLEEYMNIRSSQDPAEQRRKSWWSRG